jgi:preprotein translocase subunit SecE
MEKKRSKFAFISEAISELKKVTWPSRQEAIRLTIIVIIVCIVIGAFLGGIDFGFSQLIDRLLLR